MPVETVILGCFWVIFWPELPKMLSILVEFLTGDDMQNDASVMLQFLLKYLEKVKIWPKILFLGSFLCPKMLPNERLF